MRNIVEFGLVGALKPAEEDHYLLSDLINQLITTVLVEKPLAKQVGVRNKIYTRQGSPVTALHQGLSKYLTAQDTHVSPTPNEHNKTLSRLGNLLYSNHSPQYN